MHLNSPQHSSKYDFSTTRYPQSPSTSLENTVSKNDSIYNLLSVSNTSLDLNIEKRANKNHDKKIKIIELPTEILNKIFSYTGESKANARLTCHRFNDCVRLNKEELFKIKNSGFLSMNGFNSRSIDILSKQGKKTQSFVLKNCTLLHKSGFSPWSMLLLSKISSEKKIFILNNCKILYESGFATGTMIVLSEMSVDNQEFVLSHLPRDKNLGAWDLISLAHEHDYLIKKARRT